MTPLRQVSNAATLLACLSVAAPTLAQPLAPIGPPTVAEVAAAAPPPAPAAAPAPVAAPAPASSAKAPSWLAPRPAPKAPVAGKSALPSTGRLIGMLLVLGALGGAALYFKRRGKGDRKLTAVKQRLMVVSSTRIGPKAHAVVISVHGRQMLLGVTDASVKRLAFIDDVDEEAEAEREPAHADGARGSYGQRGSSSAYNPSTARAAAIAVRTISSDPAQARSFGELLKTAFKKREPADDASAASILAAETQDVVVGKPAPAPVRMLDVEGQAQGLIRRLGGPRS